MRTMDLPSLWMVFLETGHALDFRLDQTEMKLRSFCSCSPAEFVPMLLHGMLIELGDLTESQLKRRDTPDIRLTRLQKRFREDGSNGGEFAR